MSDKVELTDEMIEDTKTCGNRDGCEGCRMPSRRLSTCIEHLAAALQTERAKPKDDLWGGALSDDVLACVEYQNYAGLRHKGKVITRELPKSRIRIIAEKYSRKPQRDEGTMIEIIEDAILEYAGGEK